MAYIPASTRVHALSTSRGDALFPRDVTSSVSRNLILRTAAERARKK
jgi:hypothetical protein